MEIDELIKEGDALRKQGKYEEGLKYYEKAIDADPKCAKAWYEKGNALYDLKKDKDAMEAYEEAVELYNEVIEKEPDNVEALKNMGAALLKLGKDKEALEAAEKVIKIMPENARARYKKGNALYYLEEYEEALEAYEKAIEIDPNYIEAWINKGSALYRLKRYKKTLEAYEKAIEIDPIFAEAWYNKGVVLDSLEEYEKALEAYEKVIEIRPKDTDAWNNKGVVLYNLKNYKKALEAFEKTIELDQESADAWNNKGVVLYNLKNYKKALEAYEKAVKLDPEYARALNNKGTALHYLKRYEKALKAYRKAIKINPEDALPYANLGELFFDNGDLGNASDYADKALDIDKENHRALLVKGKIEIEEEKYNCAIKSFKKVIYQNLGDPVPLLWTAYARYLKAESYYSPEGKAYKGEIFKIIRELERANDLCNEFTERELRECILYFLGYFYYKNNDIFTAKEKLGECIKLESRWEKFKEFMSSESKKEKFIRFINSESRIKKLWRFITTSKSPIEQRARELLDHVWKYKIKPPWWNWWLSSPLNHWLKRTTFVLLLSPIFSLLLRSLIPEYVYAPPTKEDLSVYETIISLFFKYIPPIDKDNLSVYATIILFLLLFLLLPRVEKIKGKEVEVELGSPPSFEPFLSPPMIGEKIGDLSQRTR